MPDGRVEDTVGDNVHDLGQQECPASVLAMVINGLRKGIITGACVSGRWVGEVSYRSLIGDSPLLPATSATFTSDGARRPSELAGRMAEARAPSAPCLAG